MTEPRPDRVRIRGPLRAFADGFHAYLLERGYSLTSVQFHLQLLAHLSRWMQAERARCGRVVGGGGRAVPD